jgi:hypothetical protein
MQAELHRSTTTTREMIMLNYPNPLYNEVIATLDRDRDRSIRAAERYEIEQALRVLDEQHRSERKANRRQRLARYRRVVLHPLA